MVDQKTAIIFLFCGQCLVCDDNIAAYRCVKVQVAVCVDLIFWFCQFYIGVAFFVISKEVEIFGIELAQVYLNCDSDIHSIGAFLTKVYRCNLIVKIFFEGVSSNFCAFCICINAQVNLTFEVCCLCRVQIHAGNYLAAYYLVCVDFAVYTCFCSFSRYIFDGCSIDGLCILYLYGCCGAAGFYCICKFLLTAEVLSWVSAVVLFVVEVWVLLVVVVVVVVLGV